MRKNKEQIKTIDFCKHTTYADFKKEEYLLRMSSSLFEYKSDLKFIDFE